MSDRHVHRLRRTTAGTLAMITLAASPAAARPALEPPHHNGTVAGAPQVQTVERIDDGGLVWGSAVIGAGAATVVCMLAGAGLTTASRRHHREPRTPSASAV